MTKGSHKSRGFGEIKRQKNQSQKTRPTSSEHDNQIKLALDLINRGQLQDAEEIYKTLIQEGSRQPAVYGNLGVLLKKKGEINSALNHFSKAIQLNPNYTDAYYNQGNAYKSKGDLSSAIASFRQAIRHNPGHIDAWHNLGNILHQLGETEQALCAFQNSIKGNPNDPNIHYKIGILLQAKGDLQQSQIHLQKVLRSNPSHTGAIYELSRRVGSKEEAQVLINRTKQAGNIKLNDKEASMLHFARANCFHQLRNYTEAKNELKLANSFKLACEPSDLSDRKNEAKHYLNIANQNIKGRPGDGEGRIFIVGAPRCGSTLLESCLTTNPLIKDLGETLALKKAIKRWQQNRRESDLEELSLATAYAIETNENLTDHTHSVDKNLYNYSTIGTITTGMPSAKIIHCQRHPMDNILSMIRSNLGPGNNFCSSALDAAKFLAHQEEIMAQIKNKYSSHIYTLNYDAFTTDPEKTIKPLIAWLKLEWNSCYLGPEKNARTIHSASVIQARKPIHKKSIGGWKHYRELLEPAEAFLQKSGLFSL